MPIDADLPVPSLANPVLDLIERRTTTRKFTAEPVTAEERQAILHAASRGPSAGAMMFYSIIAIDNDRARKKLCHLCDDQPFMLEAPFWLLFVADNRKWCDLYQAVGCYNDPSPPSFPQHARRKPGIGDLLLACQDTVIAAQTAVLAAESLGIGSCYIGDVLERGEQVAELLDLPPATVPISLVVFGHRKQPTPGTRSVSCLVDDQVPAGENPAAFQSTSQETAANTPHPVVNLVMEDRYRPADPETIAAQVAELDAKFTPHAIANGAPAGERVRKLYHRKHTSDFMAEMNRSAAWWAARWCADEVDDGTVAEQAGQAKQAEQPK